MRKHFLSVQIEYVETGNAFNEYNTNKMWIKLPHPDLSELFDELGIIHAHDYQIVDYDNLCIDQELNINRLTNIFELNDLCEMLLPLTRERIQLIEAYCKATGCDDLEYIVQNVINDCVLYKDTVRSEIAYDIITLAYPTLPREILLSINFDKYADEFLEDYIQLENDVLYAPNLWQ